MHLAHLESTMNSKSWDLLYSPPRDFHKFRSVGLFAFYLRESFVEALIHN